MTEAGTPARPQVVIIGAGPGIGRAVALRFGREGHPVGLVARRSDALEAAAAEVGGAGIQVATEQGDAADPAGLADAVSRLRSHGPIGVLVYNVSLFGGPLSSADLATLREGSDVHLHAPILAVQAALPDLEAQRGTVLLTGSGLAVHPDPGAGILSVGKAMTRAAALVLAADLAPRGVKVRTVTILGRLEAGGPFDPDRIAEIFWDLHVGTDDAIELVYGGTG